MSLLPAIYGTATVVLYNNCDVFAEYQQVEEACLLVPQALQPRVREMAAARLVARYSAHPFHTDYNTQPCVISEAFKLDFDLPRNHLHTCTQPISTLECSQFLIYDAASKIIPQLPQSLKSVSVAKRPPLARSWQLRLMT